jgi:glycosyltransferase involved in cell wall biosynthesis
VAIDLAVLGHDPRFGGGSAAQTEAFLDGARTLGREPELLYAEHPVLAGRRLSLDRVEALRQLRAARTLEPAAREANELWVVATSAIAGGAAPRSDRPYDCWLGTTIDDEWRGRRQGLGAAHRAAFELSLPLLRRVESQVLAGARSVYATSRGSQAAVASALGREVDVLPIPVDTDLFTPADELPQEPVAIFVGRAWDPRKNVALLLRSWPEVRRRVPGATLRLVGDPPRVPLPEGVEAVGTVASVADELRRASLFVLPSWQEGFGIVAAEAMAAGVPVLSTRSGGPEELVEASGGGVLADPGGFAEAAAALLGDVGTLEAMRRRARSYVEREHAPAVFRERLAAALAH